MIKTMKEKYLKEVIPQMKEKFGYKSAMAVPKIVKVVINTGFGSMVFNKTGEEQKKIYDALLSDLAQMTGQKPVLTKAKKSIAAFRLRQGSPIGAKITLRRKKMFDFLDILVNVALPRKRDFRGIELKSFDPNGNLTVSMKEHIVFPEISPENVKRIFGFEITVATTAKTKEEGAELLRLLGFPIKKS
jgi:large subunit ribosomal protein L5